MRPALHARRGWYPSDAHSLAAFLREACPTQPDATPAKLLISPHAGYRFSGGVAGAAYAQVAVPDVAVVLGVGHRPARRPNVIGLEGTWETPAGPVPVDAPLANAIFRKTDLLVAAEGELDNEHSLELQLPFLRHRNPNVRIVPIQLRRLSPAECAGLGEAIATAIEGRDDTMLVASTDLHHQEARPGVHPPDVVPARDRIAMEHIEAFDPEGLYREVRSQGVTMCGLLPTTVALHAARALGADTVTPVGHATSFEVSGRGDYVVGYYSAVIR